MNATPLSPITITQEEADAIIEACGFTDQVDDYELNECGHVYTLDDGSSIVITSPTHVVHHSGEEEGAV